MVRLTRTLPQTLAFALVAAAALAQQTAQVYRDVNGVPHIKSATEPAAWYAMGYEQARDGLYLIQAQVKRHRGQALRYLDPGDAAPNKRSDFIVKVLSVDDLTDPTQWSAAQLQGLLTVTLYDNLKAYAKGVDQYRQLVKTPSGDQPAQDMKNWLDANSLQWVYNDPVTVNDFAAWGAYSKAILHLAVGGTNDPTPVVTGPGAITDTALEIDAEFMSKYLKWYVPGSGSNGFAWGRAFHAWADPSDPVGETWRFTGLVADPHTGGVDSHFTYKDGPGRDRSSVHQWYCHLIVQVESNPPTLNAFGHVPYGAGVMFICHNSSIAFGGSFSLPNIMDTMLLRLKVENNQIVKPEQYYSYYGTPGYHPLVKEEIKVEKFNGTGEEKYYVWRAGRFGFVKGASTTSGDPVPVYTHDEDKWFAEGSAFGSGPNVSPSKVAPTFEVPGVVAHRMPMDPAVDPNHSHHWRLAVAFYSFMKAASVNDIVAKLNDHDAGYHVDFCAIDRNGDVFASMLGTVPQRGWVEGMTRPPNTPAVDSTKYQSQFAWHDIYDKNGDKEPVPVRKPWDRQFDWIDGGGVIQYLKADGLGVWGNHDYMPYTLFAGGSPVNPPAPPAPDGSGGPPGYVSVSNDQVFYAYSQNFDTGATAPGAPNPYNTRTFDATMAKYPKNLMLYGLTEANTTYHVQALTEMNNKTKYTLDYLAARGPSNPMDHYDAKQLAVDNKLYKAPGASNAEAVASLMILSNDATGIVARFTEDVHFFEDLWTTLHTTQDATWLAFKANAVDNHNGIMPFWSNAMQGWYNIPTALTSPVPLIDFLWNDPSPGSLNVSEYQAAVNVLSGWDGRMELGSQAAAIFLTHVMGFTANAPQLSRQWVPLRDGKNLMPSTPGAGVWGDTGQYIVAPQSPAFFLLQNGALPALNANGTFQSDSSRYPQRIRPYVAGQWVGYTEFGGFLTTHKAGTLVVDAVVKLRPGLDNPSQTPAWKLRPPLTALYSNPATRTVKTTPTPTDVTKLVEYFLKLGDWIPWDFDLLQYDNSGEHQAYVNKKHVALKSANIYDAATQYPAFYPLTADMARVHFMQRLVQAKTLVGNRALGDVARARVFSFDGTRRWPSTGPTGVASMATWARSEFLRSSLVLAQHPNPEQSGDTYAWALENTGLASSYWCSGGSQRPLVTFFSEEPESAPESFFWNTPGQRVMDFQSVHMADMMAAYASNALRDTHYADYTDPQFKSPDTRLPTATQHPYVLTYIP